ncbi:MAG: hypothetical protein M3209_12995 [Acidobacteriota bacterium]|nr:hypothetical protein [Acidobacteriota bacterium]
MNYRKAAEKAEKAKEAFDYYRPSAVGERFVTNAVSKVEIRESKSLWRWLIAIGTFGNAAIWLFLLLFPSAFSTCVDLLLNLGKFAGIFFSIPFWFIFVAVYSVFRLKKPDYEETPQFESDLMSTYSYRTEANKVWLVWICAGMVAGLNLMLFIFAYWFL